MATSKNFALWLGIVAATLLLIQQIVPDTVVRCAGILVCWTGCFHATRANNLECFHVSIVD
jgi:hypothetical protein